LFLPDERPLLIEFQVVERKVLHALIEKAVARIAEVDQELANRSLVQPGEPYRRTNRRPLNKQVQGSLGVIDWNRHSAENARLCLAPGLSARQTTIALIAIAITPKPFTLRMSTSNHHNATFPVLWPVAYNAFS
jgi:hypothetical protein